ncbi:hypothetical protein ACFWUW_14630 [Streptomyces sp. NPDC058655]|uniref:hypothetical protein n=1 Tax=Streptomyces sp. NPDC058655 TaxID=3346577 RepID=UPI00364FE4FD
MSDTHVVLYDPQGLIEAELPLDRAPHEALVTAVLAWKNPDLESRDYEQIALQLTGHARAVAADGASVRHPVGSVCVVHGLSHGGGDGKGSVPGTLRGPGRAAGPPGWRGRLVGSAAPPQRWCSTQFPACPPGTPVRWCRPQPAGRQAAVPGRRTAGFRGRVGR